MQEKIHVQSFDMGPLLHWEIFLLSDLLLKTIEDNPVMYKC
jgi:hypothetical protein